MVVWWANTAPPFRWLPLKAHSYDVRVWRVRVRQTCALSQKIEKVLINCTATVCRIRKQKRSNFQPPEWAFTDMLQICWNLQEPIAANNWKLFLLFATQPSPLQQSLQLWLVWTRLKSHSSCGHCRWRIRPWSVWPDCCDLLKVLGNKKVLATLENCFGI